MRPIPLTALHSSLILTIVLIPFVSMRGQEPKPKDPSALRPARAAADLILDDLLAAHNKVRAAEDLPPLKANARLTEAARAHARDMAEHDKLSHDGSDGSDPPDRIKRAKYHYQEVGENVASGQESVGEVMRTWIESPPHRKNILGDFKEMGGAVAKGPDGKEYWCVDFGRPMAEVDPAKSPGEMIAALNRARSDAKKKPLRADPTLARVAARFARHAAERKSLETRDRDGNTAFDLLQREGFRARRFGMSLASGEGEPAKVVASWLKDAQDRDALLSGFERVGVGVATDSDGVPYWVILFAQMAARP
jgi:uncharacterized protein YkwD